MPSKLQLYTNIFLFFQISHKFSKMRYYGYEALGPCVRNTSKLFYPLRPALTIGKVRKYTEQLYTILRIVCIRFLRTVR